MKKVSFLLILFACTSACAFGQANPTASRAGDLQIGVGYTTATSEYLTNTAAPVPNPYFTDRIRGLAFYTDFDFRPHWGAEVNFHQLNSPVTGDAYERTYEFGGRYLRHYGRVSPYVKGLYGRGVFNFYQDEANLAYNMLVGGAGIDVAATRRINIRADYEYQHWMSFQFSGLNPQLVTIGAAYHFGAGKPH